MKLLTKQKRNRPFITEVVDMFPESFSIKADIDKESMRKLKEGKINLDLKKVAGTGLFEIKQEYSEMKDRVKGEIG